MLGGTAAGVPGLSAAGAGTVRQPWGWTTVATLAEVAAVASADADLRHSELRITREKTVKDR
ncbi:MAG: hypothetical protein ACRDSG_04565, partial [Pseudonocardiaceae bacterium]